MTQSSKQRLRPDVECVFADIDRRSEECYHSFEKINHSLAYLASLIERTATPDVLIEDCGFDYRVNSVLRTLPKASK